MIAKVLIGLAAGAVFGYALQRTGITRYPRIIGLLLLRDFKVLKFMLSAVLVSMIGFQVLASFGVITLFPKPFDYGKIVGGLIFGLGMGILGYCPGTLAARIGEAKKETWLAALGMVLGIGFFAVNHSAMKAFFLTPVFSGDLAALWGVDRWLLVAVFALVFGAILYWAERAGDDDRQIFQAKKESDA